MPVPISSGNASRYVGTPAANIGANSPAFTINARLTITVQTSRIGPVMSKINAVCQP